MNVATESRVSPRSTFKKTVTVKSRLGLHARPAALLINVLRPFKCQVMVEAGGEMANARSILGLLSLGAACGTPLTFIAGGADALQALKAVEELFQSDLGEGV